MAVDFMDKIEKANERIPTNEAMVGKGLLQPFNNTNAGARKLMHGTHRDHIFPLMNGEKEICGTGYEIRWGDMSSSILRSDADYRIVSKITKFSFSPNHHYYLIVEDPTTRKLDVIERISYHHITESYGYLYNNEYIDSKSVGDIIPRDTIVQKSLAFDEYNNRKDGVNLNVAYIALDQNQEDSVIFSDVAAKKLTSPLIKVVTIMINENDIPLNLHGTEDVYKCIPDIGEDIKDSILLALRKEKKEESLYNQSIEHLKKPMMSDKKYTLKGKVIDVNIYCNNLDNLDTYHNSQFKMYNDELQRMSTEVVQTVTQYISSGYELSYELEKLYNKSKRIINHELYMDKRQFSNIVLEVTVLEENQLAVGDKTSNRFGGKGVTSAIIPQEMMPKFGDEYVDVIFNPYTMPNRENPGQSFETEINFVGHQIVKRIASGLSSVEECMDMIYRFYEIVSPVQGEFIRNKCTNRELCCMYLEGVIQDGDLHQSIKPLSESFDIYRLMKLYDSFPWVDQVEVTVPIKGSDGTYRRIPCRRKMIVGKQYIFRLKQYAEEKFSATSLSATNIRNENAKSKANRNFMELHRNTPIRFGNMEMNDMNHLGVEVVVTALMIHSVSPHARRLAEQMYVDDPFNVDIRLSNDSTNRSAQIVNTYLKVLGRKLVFKKMKKKLKKPFTINPVVFNKPLTRRVIFFNKEPNYDAIKEFEEISRIEDEKKKNPNVKSPITFEARDLKRKK